MNSNSGVGVTVLNQVWAFHPPTDPPVLADNLPEDDRYLKAGKPLMDESGFAYVSHTKSQVDSPIVLRMETRC